MFGILKEGSTLFQDAKDSNLNLLLQLDAHCNLALNAGFLKASKVADTVATRKGKQGEHYLQG